MDTKDKYDELTYIVEGIGKKATDYFNANYNDSKLKRDGSVVTEVDGAIEHSLRHFISTNFPEDAIIGEEKKNVEGTSGFEWHVDPIDGTDNFLRKIPFFAISIARLGNVADESFAIIHNPATRQTFSTFRETVGEVYEGKHLCNLTAEPLGGKYVISIGRSSKEDWMKPATYALNRELGLKYGRCTSYNCTALELAYIAGNRIDAYLTFGLNTYDYAAGFFLVKAAGGAISVFEDNEWRRWETSIKDLCSVTGRTIFASHPDIHDEILDFIGNPAEWAEK